MLVHAAQPESFSSIRRWPATLILFWRKTIPVTNSFNPNISTISCFSSDFSFEIHVSVVGLIPHEMYQLWAFFPDGEAIGGQRVRSNEHGYLLNMQGGQDVFFGTHSSLAIPKGLYTLGIIRGEFTFKRKPYLQIGRILLMINHISTSLYHTKTN